MPDKENGREILMETLVLEKLESGSNVCEDMCMSYVIIYREQGGWCLF